MAAWRCPLALIALFLAGAVNETRELLMHHLHERALPCYHESLHNILAGLRKNDLQIATQIFLRQGRLSKENYPAAFARDASSIPLDVCLKRGIILVSMCVSGFQPKQDFVNKSRHLYGSEPAELKSLQQINDWVYNATNGKMPQFLSALPLNVLVMLINAVHFKGIAFLQLDFQRTNKYKH